MSAINRYPLVLYCHSDYWIIFLYSHINSTLEISENETWELGGESPLFSSYSPHSGLVSRRPRVCPWPAGEVDVSWWPC